MGVIFQLCNGCFYFWCLPLLILIFHSCYSCAFSCPTCWWCFGLLCSRYCVVRWCCCVNQRFMPLFYVFMFLCLAAVDCSILGTIGVDIVDNCWVGCVIDIVWCKLLFLMFSGTLDISVSNVVVVGVAAIDVLWWIERSVIWIICLISSDMLPLPKFLIALAQYSISVITLSACVMVGWVIFLCIKCTVSVNCLLLVNFMWHLCVR